MSHKITVGNIEATPVQVVMSGIVFIAFFSLSLYLFLTYEKFGGGAFSTLLAVGLGLSFVIFSFSSISNVSIGQLSLEFDKVKTLRRELEEIREKSASMMTDIEAGKASLDETRAKFEKSRKHILNLLHLSIIQMDATNHHSMSSKCHYTLAYYLVVEDEGSTKALGPQLSMTLYVAMAELYIKLTELVPALKAKEFIPSPLDSISLERLKEVSSIELESLDETNPSGKRDAEFIRKYLELYSSLAEKQEHLVSLGVDLGLSRRASKGNPSA